mmetsp:Transcript_11305/g.12905  ORF Transcript_11305/g.12905 Transcript_11305/m.12905 type:complete len:216 (+) Transcript_11305:70-717(+)
MMKCLALAFATLSTFAASFAPIANPKQHNTALNAFENELGAQRPLGFWDPLNFISGPEVTQERFDRLRYVEIKHGRISMLAFLGHVMTTQGLRLSGSIDMEGTTFASIPTGLKAFSKIPDAGLIQLFLFIGFLELNVMKDVNGTATCPGDLRNGKDFGWSNFSDEEQRGKRAIELNNGRAAMMGILGLMVHEGLTGEPYVLNSLLGYPSNFNAGF